jgi:hypothetical protein
MPFETAHYLTTLLPAAACADPVAVASALDRLADLALFHGRASFAEHLARRAEALREARTA